MLDATLTSTSAAGATRPAMPLRWLPDPGLALLVASGGRLAGEPRSIVSMGPGRVSDNGALRTPHPRRARPRPARVLTVSERDALGRLRAAGASWLRDDFTAPELRRAWRQLARLWHPDVAAPEVSADAANRMFATLSASYRLLRRAGS